MEKEKLITTNEAAEILGVHQSRIYALIQAERLPAIRFGKSWAIKKGDLKLVKDRNPGRPSKTKTKNSTK